MVLTCRFLDLHEEMIAGPDYLTRLTTIILQILL